MVLTNKNASSANTKIPTASEIANVIKQHAPWFLAASWIILAPLWFCLIWWLGFLGICAHIFGWVLRRLKRQKVTGMTVLITGGAMGLGKATANKFASEGNKIVLWDVREDKLQETAAELKKHHKVVVHTYVVDVTKDNEVIAAVEKVQKDVGYVDIVVLNAGVVSGYSLIDLPLDKMRRVYEVNNFQLYSVTQTFLKTMVRTQEGQARGGHFVVMSSMSAFIGVNKMTDYCATKAAAYNFTEALEAEIHTEGWKNIYSTVVCPYFINTGMFNGTTPLSFFPFLEEADVASEIFEAVALKKKIVVLPWHMYSLCQIKNIFFPTFLAPLFDRFIGFSRAMTTFSGRHV